MAICARSQEVTTIEKLSGTPGPAPVSIVTGGGRGIGRAVAVALAADGHQVCVNDTGVDLAGGAPSCDAARAVAEEIRAAGGCALAISADARTAEGARQLLGEVDAWAGRPATVLVHAAGTLRDAMAHNASAEDWSEVLGSHLSVAVELTRGMARTMRAGRWGRIVYVGGAAGLVGSVGQAAYVVAKAGLFGLTRAIALEMAGRDVCVNYLAPFAFTRMTESIPPVTDQLRSYLSAAPRATAGDIAPVVTWLCSAASAGITGQVLSARGAQVAIWSQPRPVAEVCEAGGWDRASMQEVVRPCIEPYLTALESEFDLFGGPPVVVTGRSHAS